MRPFLDRVDAGRRLARELGRYRNRADVIVLGLPRGGVPVAAEIARALDLQLDVLVVRKIGMPGQPEVAFGAAATGGVVVINSQLAGSTGATPQQLRDLIERKVAEVEQRERTFGAARRTLAVKGRIVLLVDDGAATGATMLAAVRCARQMQAKRVVVVLPVAAGDALIKLEREADEVLCLQSPSDFRSVGDWYENFGQTQDAEVVALLAEAREPHAAH